MKIAVLAILVVFAVVGGVQAVDDGDLFTIMYQKISDLVAPEAANVNVTGVVPKVVFLMEMPGLAISREDFDPDVWSADSFKNRQPSAVLASLVDRAPAYIDATFIDSGATISGIWGHFMHQYLVPFTDSDIQQRMVQEAREKLWNSTLELDFENALDVYDDQFRSNLDARKQCLEGNNFGELCGQLLVVDELRLSVAWFNMETRRRDLHAAQSAILALQLQDLTTLFADSLRKFERNKRVDVGESGYGNEFYQTFATPSNFWQWWPMSSSSHTATLDPGQLTASFAWDELYLAGGLISENVDAHVLLGDTGGPTVFIAAQEGTITGVDENGFNYTAKPGFVGVDSATFEFASDGSTFSVTIGVVGSVPDSTDAAFSAISLKQSEFSYSRYASTSTVASYSTGRIRVWGWVRAGSNYDFTATSRVSTFSESTSTQMSFEIAKVIITRPWIDLSLLSFKPVAIRGLAAGAWGDGTGVPNPEKKSRFPLLPQAMIVARNVEISSDTFSSSGFSSTIQEVTHRARYRSVNYGPFFTGSRYSASSSNQQRQYSSSSWDSSSNTVSIAGPQIIGWVCSPIPSFPTASSATVEKINFGQVITPYSTTDG